MKRRAIVAVLGVALLAGCSSTPDKSDESARVTQPEISNNLGLPGWVVNPQVEQGLADVACVPWSGNMSIDREQATAMARNALINQIGLKGAVMTKTFAHKTDTTAGSNIGADFEASARQLAEAKLQGSRASKADLIQIDGKKQFCVMVTLQPQQTEQLFGQMVKASGAQLSSDDERVLFEQFRAYKAQQELERALQN